MAIKAHPLTCPSHIPGNLIAVVSWHAIGELYHVSRSLLYLWIWVLNPAFQRNVLHWEQVDPPWEIPNSVSDLTRALQDTQAWLASSGIVKSMVVAAPPTLPPPVAPIGCESEVRISDGELPVSKVRWSDEVEHTLDKGLWVGTGAMWQGCKVFVKVSPICFLSSGRFLIS